MGDDVFTKFLRELLSQNIDKSIRTSEVQTIAEAQSHLQLTPFFSQWVDGTGAPQFGNNYQVYRLGSGKGFRTVGTVTQDLDLFKMPVELRIDTEGKTDQRRVDLSGTESAYNVETFGRPRKITIDPENWLLKSTPDLAVRVAVLRGQQDVAQGDLLGKIFDITGQRERAVNEYRLAIQTNDNTQGAINEARSLMQKPYQRDNSGA
jgi:hypothetical protein